MGGQSRLSELSVISWVSAFEGCPLSGVPLYKQSIVVCKHKKCITSDQLCLYSPLYMYIIIIGDYCTIIN